MEGLDGGEGRREVESCAARGREGKSALVPVPGMRLGDELYTRGGVWRGGRRGRRGRGRKRGEVEGERGRGEQRERAKKSEEKKKRSLEKNKRRREEIPSSCLAIAV